MEQGINFGISVLEDEKKKLAGEAERTGDWEPYDVVAQKVLALKERSLVTAEA